MFLLESKGGAIGCMLLSLFFLGTWPAFITYLERRGRLPQHTYLDYTITNLLTAVLIAFTLGQIGGTKPDMPNFLTQLSQVPKTHSVSLFAMGGGIVLTYSRLLTQDNFPSVLFAMGGGIVLSVANLSTQYAWALVGLSVVEVVSASIAVVIGTTLNYFLDGRINKAAILFPGVGCFLIAVFLGAAVHKSNAADNKKKLADLSNDPEEQANGTEGEPGFGTAAYLVQVEDNRSIKVIGRNIWLGMAITVFAGLCLAFFSPLFNLATNDQFHHLKEGVPHLVVYTAFFYFSISFFVVAVVLNIIFLYHPVMGLPKSSFIAYLSDWHGRGWALLAGLTCACGNGLQFMGGQAAGYAAADVVQALPLVSTFWGVVIFGEYRKSSRTTYILLVSMLLMFIVAVGILLASSGHRKES